MTASGSSERFDHYVERRLYGPDGFYSTGGGAGRRGDFITSPEVGPLFGELMVNACHRWWQDLGQPQPFTVVDLGTGPGTLLRSMQLALEARPYGGEWELLGIDRAGPHGGMSLPDDLSRAVVLGNELLDNIPFRVVEMSEDGPLELFVRAGTEVLESAGDDAAVNRVLALPGVAELPAGTRLPVQAGAAELVDDLLARRPARLCLLDYGETSTATLAARGGWLRAFRGHERISDVLREDVAFDITTDVALDQLPEITTVSTQADFLADNGIEQLVEEGRAYWRENAARPDLTALRFRSRISEAEALLDAEGLGSWKVAVW